MSVSKENNIHELLQFFRSMAERGADSTKKSYLKAVAVLDAFLKKTDAVALQLSYSFLAEWLLHMSMRGLTVKTSIHYLDAIASLYKSAVKEGLAPESDAFKEIRTRMASADLSGWENPITDEEFKRVVNVTQTAYNQSGTIAVSTDLFLFSLLNACMPLAEVAKLKTKDTANLDSESLAIAERRSDRKRKYLFPLKQSGLTPSQLNRYVNDLLLHLFRFRNIPLRGSVEETIAGYWVYAGLRCGFSGEDMVACLGRPSDSLPFLSLVNPKPISDSRKAEIAQAVAEVFVVNPLRWFAMRLRPHVKFEHLIDRFDLLKEEVSRPELFYPRNEIVKRIGKKLKYELKPVISDVVFFRTRITEIFPLFCRIGDLSWCYTYGGKNSRQYAYIADDSFKAFQQAIGQFTPDFEVAPVGQLSMKKGDKIVIVGSMLSGQTGEVAKIEKDAGDNIIYRVKFGTENGFKWDFGVDARITKCKDNR